MPGAMIRITLLGVALPWLLACGEPPPDHITVPLTGPADADYVGDW